MTDENVPEKSRLRLLPPAPAGFDPLTATATDLARHGLPRRPDPDTEPGLAALWEQKAVQYRNFEHLAPAAHPAAVAAPLAVPGLGPDPIDSCGYNLTSNSGPFTSLFITWTVPDLQYDGDAFGINSLHTFAGLGFLDVHVQLTVDSSQSVTCVLWAEDVGDIELAVRPGDVLSASLCLNTNAAGTAAYFFTNETTAQTMSFSVDTGFPPAVTVNAGVTRDGVIRPGQSLARFGSVYFDEISAYNSSGHQSLLAGELITMTDTNGNVLANAYELTDYAFKVVSG
jgi:Peptidase A4 family